MAFNAKNLHYEKQEPAFLRKLRGEHNTDRHNVQIARPQKDRLKTGDEDDGPTMVDETGGNVSKEEYQAMLMGRDGGDDSSGGKSGEGEIGQVLTVENAEEVAREVDDVKAKSKVAEIGAPKKRKKGKVVGNDVEDVDIIKVSGKTVEGNTDVEEVKPKGKPNKAKKKVKLSFEEPD